MASSMILYWGSGSPPCWRVMIALEEKNLQGYQQKLLSFEKNEHKSEPVMAINPRGQLPSFKHGDNIINESFGACLYLENQFKSQGTQLIPDSSAEQALVYQRMFETFTLQQKMEFIELTSIYINQFKSQGTQLIPDSSAEQALVYQRMFETLTLQQKMEFIELTSIYINQFKSQGTQLIPDSSAEQALVYQRMFETLTLQQKMEDYVIKYLKMTNMFVSQMDAGSYAAGKNFTMADVMVFPQIAYAFRFGLSPEKFIKLGEYHNLVKKRPSVEASWPPHWKENPQGMDILKDF
ncbi:UNVERIFIED_CONTAM: hypothetical protein FKN15_065039 [Acipenser sinensis]